MHTVHVTVAALCRKMGRLVPWWTQGAGGNVSRKANGILYIKASGVRLADVEADGAIATLAYRPLAECVERSVRPHQRYGRDSSADADIGTLLQDLSAKSASRPSMESGMHAVLPGRDVVHLHALLAIVLAEQARVALGPVVALLARYGLSCALVPPTLPGPPLARAAFAARHADVLLLANHGVVLQGEASSVWPRWQAVERCWLDQHPSVAALIGDDAMQLSWRFAPATAVAKLPDAAVFWPRILAATEPCAPPSAKLGSGGVTGISDNWHTGDDNAGAHNAWRRLRATHTIDVDACEIWSAQVALQALAPSLAPLPSGAGAALRAAPAEQYRLRQRGQRRRGHVDGVAG